MAVIYKFSVCLQVTKLFEGSEYDFRVAAENKIGVSDFVQTSEPVRAKMPFGERHVVLVHSRSKLLSTQPKPK